MENVTNQERLIEQRENSAFRIWDSEYCPSSEAFSFFREEICSIFMPWAPEFRSEQQFEGRIKALTFKDKSIAYVKMTPLVAVRTNISLANSAVDGFYANFVLNGEVQIEQAGHSTVAKRGDFVVYDTARPVKLKLRGSPLYEDIAFLIPKKCFGHVESAEKYFGNVVVTQDRLISPLRSILLFLADNIESISNNEMISLYKSCVSLLPVAAGCFNGQRIKKLCAPRDGGMRLEMLEFINKNIARHELSPEMAAQNFGISVRYVHKLFAENGTTFSTYVVAKRLHNIREDLVSRNTRNHPISMLAFRWGFRDLSSFNRAFKKRFGCTPKHYRAMPDWSGVHLNQGLGTRTALRA